MVVEHELGERERLTAAVVEHAEGRRQRLVLAEQAPDVVLDLGAVLLGRVAVDVEGVPTTV